ncbi:MAG: tRNA pseudouridine(38-40) synthase TruA [Lachnospiraceae bacterium]
MEQHRILLEVSYDGTNYHGWQIQKNAISIEEVLNKELSTLLKEEIEVIGASRTDAGVHAKCNIAVFDTCTNIPANKIANAINHCLPEDIRIQNSYDVKADFHPRRTPTKKTYEYRVNIGAFEDPTKRLYTHFTYLPLNIESMREAASYIIGEHDFESFSVAKKQVASTVRTIFEIDIREQENEIIFTIRGNGFLHNMVRIIVGTLLVIGAGRKKPEDMITILEAKRRTAAGPTAPAKGLCLKSYEFDVL